MVNKLSKYIFLSSVAHGANIYAEPVVLFEIHRHPKRLRNSPSRILENGASLLRNRLFLPTLHFLVALFYVWPDSLILSLPLKFKQILGLDVGILCGPCVVGKYI